MIDGTIRSIPIRTICVLGIEIVKSAFPSLVDKLMSPVLAMAKLQPVIPTSDFKKSLRMVSLAQRAKLTGLLSPS